MTGRFVGEYDLTIEDTHRKNKCEWKTRGFLTRPKSCGMEMCGDLSFTLQIALVVHKDHRHLVFILDAQNLVFIPVNRLESGPTGDGGVHKNLAPLRSEGEDCATTHERVPLL